ncbi:hypothetical protein ACFP1Z_31830 [Streptomyces gamaensis]|uniref:CdiI immunity protein domain-containing protein n=1 Tax=Streptomyces gamaensis TaxID=1763542 RepID=A0ABW0ZCB2_9ACTN
MNRELRNFVRTYLDLEMAYDTKGWLRPTLLGFNEHFVNNVRSGLEEILRDRSLTVGEYEGLTAIEFPDEDTLYKYLEDMYAFLFEGRPEQPEPPEDF